ncbi:MAG: aminotransferase class I/II-fold pyridoxal phosphate-dependent enzyme [Salinivirgaceae bacterium]|nr:aminotransferase class I/II-fold pyridoxal phosphate-dependent enzyme [Salinivirgaceae bacterium]
MYTDFREQLCSRLAAINDAGLYNSLGTLMSTDAVIEIDGQKLLNFSSPAPFALNGYYSVGQDEGCQPETATALETRIARLLNADDCILYNSPSDANAALTNRLLNRADAVIYNALSQFALSGGPTFCRATKYKYHGFDIDDIEKQLKLSQAQQNRLLIIDAVDLASGNIAPLNRILALAERYKAVVTIDQTLSAGLIGQGGRGVCSLFDDIDAPEIQTGTLQHLGSNAGAYIAGRREIIDFLRQQPSGIQAAAPLMPQHISTACTAIDSIVQMDTERQYILQITNYFIKKLYCLGLEIPPTQTSHLAVMVGDSQNASLIASTLARKGVLVSVAAAPFVSKDDARLIISLSAKHTKNDIERAAEIFKSVPPLFHKETPQTH